MTATVRVDAPTTLRVARCAAPGVEWDAFVKSCAGWTHFHLSGWERVIRDTLGHESLYLEARTPDGTLAGVLPLVRVKSPIFGHFVVSVPFVNYGGPLGSDEAVQALAAHAVQLATRDRADLLELRSRTALPLDLSVSHRKITVVLDLAATEDATFKAFPAKLRSQVRKPQKEGVIVKFGAELLPDFYRVFSYHMRDLGTPVLSRKLFDALASEFSDSAWVAVAYLKDTPIAAGMGFRWGNEFEVTWASSLREFSKVSPNMGLYWAMMQRAVAEGCTVFNFGRCTPGSNTHRFKSQWGSRDETLSWYQWSPNGVVKTPSPDGGAMSLGPRVWRHLPVAIANRLGPHVVRLIP